MLDFFREHKKGIVGTLIFHGILVMVFIFSGFSTPLPLPAEQGIMINFGNVQDASGAAELEQSIEKEAEQSQETPAVQQEQQQADVSTPPASQEETTQETDKQVETQDFQEAPALEESSKEEKQQEEKEPNPEPTDNTDESQETEKQQEDKQPEREVNQEALYPGKSTQESGESEGETQGQGNQGRESGSPYSDNHANVDSRGMGNINFSLEGRNPESLPKPEYNYQVEGKVVVEITVDRQGNVTKAEAGMKGSTTLNDKLLRAARKAALNARFDPKPNAPAYQKGTITYYFRLQ